MVDFLSDHLTITAIGSGIILFVLGGLLASFYWRIIRWSSEKKQFQKRSRSVLTGLVAEQFAPHFPAFPTHPGEARFIGKPIDYIAFRGLESGEVDEIIFVEVKSGRYPRLSAVERSVRDTVQRRNVRWIQLDLKP